MVMILLSKLGYTILIHLNIREGQRIFSTKQSNFLIGFFFFFYHLCMFWYIIFFHLYSILAWPVNFHLRTSIFKNIQVSSYWSNGC